MATDPRVKSRLRLWLASERAMGLRLLPVRTHGGAQAATEPVRPASPSARPPAALAARSSPQAIVPPRAPATIGAMPPLAVVPLPMVTDAPFTAPPLSLEEKRQRLIALDNNEVRNCTKCRLCKTRTQTVFGEGDPGARIFFVGEGPGENEDLSGRPFVGRAGQLLDKMIGGMGLRREQVYIANIVKCRPPGNRLPAPDEVATCTPYLQRQLEIVRPQVIVTLGLASAKYMLGNDKLAMGKIRGQWHSWRGIKLMPTFHPSYVLRTYTEEVRAAVWSDLKAVLSELGMPIPSREKSS
ncbi:MAG TPA: uracil-DNA glycosylase [Tepidisphaeraceae bacterium]|jgi:DNA polymerase